MRPALVHEDEVARVHGGYLVAPGLAGGLVPLGGDQRLFLRDQPSRRSARPIVLRLTGARRASAHVAQWSASRASGAPRHYRVEVATSPFFVAAGKVTERDQLGTTEFGVSDLRTGIYFWRVCAVASSGQVSEWTESQKFTIAATDGQTTDERITISTVSFEFVAGTIYLLRGRTQPGNTIRINGRETLAAADGSFQLQISVPKAAREIAVEAEDSQGTQSHTRLAFTPDAGQR